MPDTATNGAAPIDLPFLGDPFAMTAPEPTKDTPPAPAIPAAPAATDKPANAPSPPKTEETDDIFDEAQYVKNTFGWDSVDIAKQELAELRRIKEESAKPITFANPDSEKAYNYLKEGKEAELYSHLDRKIKLSKAESLEAKNAIALHLQMTNPAWTQQDIDDVMEETYPVPPQPKAEEGEEPTAFELRKAEWTAAVDKINRRITRDSLAAKEQLKKLHSEIILPDIKRDAPVDPQAAQKVLDAQQARERYATAIESAYNTASGFKATVKDKEVEIGLTYDLTPEEKIAYKDKAKNLDLPNYFGARWFNEDGTPKVDKIMHDLYRLDNEEKIDAKFANDGASKRMEAYLKDKKQTNLGKPPEGTFKPNVTAETEEALGKWAFAN